MKEILPYSFFILILVFFLSASVQNDKDDHENIIIENTELKLIISPAGIPLSLLHKPTGEECLYENVNIPISAITEYRPYDNELFLTYPAKSRTFGANRVWREGNLLKVKFEQIAYTATITLNITDDYIGFKLTHLDYNVEKIGVKRRTEIDEFTLLQLPVKHRKNFGEWLNVVWDDKIAVNLLAADIYAKIDALCSENYNLLYAKMEDKVKLMDVEAALITTSPDKLLDRIDTFEKDYNLPKGVESRRNEAYRYSYYELRDVSITNIDRHLEYAKQGGFKMVVIYYPDFSYAMGHFPWRENYANGMDDLKAITHKIREAGMIPGVHIHYNKAAKNDLYVSPVPDPRLNLVRMFTLSNSVDVHSSTIYVEENPEGCTLEEERRFLKIGNELVTYTNYTTTPPYSFTGCSRGALGSTVKAVEKGFKFGLLDIDTWPLFVRFDQNTSIQQEVAERIGEIYTDAGFEFVYFDGAEDVHYPYWHNVSKAQLIVYNQLDPKPLLSEGALKSHFGWHILTRGNAFDLFEPEHIREATNHYTITAAKYIAQDFSSINFGWNDYLAPDETTIGMQPDMYEYICSRGAAWDCPIALMGKLDQLEKHPRTDDNLEVIRNWENVRIKGLLTNEQKEQLKSTSQEHILLKNRQGDYELHSYECIDVKETQNISAFIFERNNKTMIVYWHTRGSGEIILPIQKNKICLYDPLDTPVPIQNQGDYLLLPANKRRYIELDMPKHQAMSLFKKIKYIPQ
jgi:hypothetical protein